MGTTNHPTDSHSFYSALSHSPVRAAGNKPNLTIHRPRALQNMESFATKYLQRICRPNPIYTARNRKRLIFLKLLRQKWVIKVRWLYFFMACRQTDHSGRKFKD